ncbi:SCO2521 family protein [Sphaerisporangium sp. TRM90804]|uniref:SCO2521 family protein n=1 Tax=Sphaerisporangium sp. TRM90804 TaxID=3031113 RepID=UPI00244D1128|nr:SCO2521 family protein [Sphaerisporangium sp. TRM90804]MDH2424338.1 SCO2521 family protein [Sphaerisporangium sp. TRM90804]
MVGEVQTGLLQNSGEIPDSLSTELLALVRGERVRVFRRPIAYAVSPDRLTGVDCHLASASGARVRGVGTVLSRASVTGGRLVQGSSQVRVTRGTSNRRLAWSHYMARPGVVEVVGKARAADLAGGFTLDAPPAESLDLGAVSARFVDVVQSSARLDRRAPFRMARTRFRWTAEPGEPDVRLQLRGDNVRTLRLTLPDPFAPGVAELCEDLALHDWLLTALIEIVRRARPGSVARPEAAARLAPAIDHILHLWMPAARVQDSLLHVWESLEHRPGFTRQWQSLVNRVRDHVTVALLTVAGGDGRSGD